MKTGFRRAILFAGLTCMLGPALAGAYDLTRFKNNEAPEQLLCADFELTQRPRENAWTAAQDAFWKIRRVQEEQKAGRELAQIYNEALAPSLRRLRHSVFFTVKMTQTLVLSLTAIETNAKKGVVSEPRGAYDFKAGEEKTPRPVAAEDLLKFNGMAKEEAAAARKSLEKALAELERAESGKASKAGQEARDALAAAVRKALEVAKSMEALEAEDGALAQDIRATQRYMEIVNRKKGQDADAYKQILVKNNDTMRVFARSTADLAENLDQAKLLHVEIDKLGTL